MSAIISYILSVFATLLPPRYRKDGLNLRGPALICAILQVLVCVFALVLRLTLFVAAHLGADQPGLPRGAAELIFLKYGDAGTMATGPFALVDFWLRPLSMVFGYFVIEGVVRFAGALSGHQVIGTLPLYAISGVHGILERRQHKEYLGPLVVDEVARGGANSGYDLKVYSCRPKLNWNPYMTVEYEGEFYQMLKEEPGQTSRRFVYYLRKNPVGRLVVVIDHYKVDAVLQPVAEKWAGTPRVSDKLLPKQAKTGIPDEIIQSTSPNDAYDFKILSASAKDWNIEVVIEFGNQRYQLFKEERGPKPHPYVYYLRKSQETRPSAPIRKYDGLISGRI